MYESYWINNLTMCYNAAKQTETKIVNKKGKSKSYSYYEQSL